MVYFDRFIIVIFRVIFPLFYLHPNYHTDPLYWCYRSSARLILSIILLILPPFFYPINFQTRTKIRPRPRLETPKKAKGGFFPPIKIHENINNPDKTTTNSSSGNNSGANSGGNSGVNTHYNSSSANSSANNSNLNSPRGGRSVSGTSTPDPISRRHKASDIAAIVYSAVKALDSRLHDEQEDSLTSLLKGKSKGKGGKGENRNQLSSLLSVSTSNGHSGHSSV